MSIRFKILNLIDIVVCVVFALYSRNIPKSTHNWRQNRFLMVSQSTPTRKMMSEDRVLMMVSIFSDMEVMAEAMGAVTDPVMGATQVIEIQNLVENCTSKNSNESFE
jgi:hypothetical protein